MIELSSRYKDKITDLLAFSFTGPVKIYAYGSRVKGNAHEGSDLDLVIESSQPLEKLQKELKKFEINFEASTVPIFVNLKVWAELPDYFKEEIDRHKILFFEK